MTEIWICRHGETEWTKSGKHTSVTDIALTADGEKQADLLGKTLQKTTFDKVYASPLKRAQMTAQLAGFKPETSPLIAEWNYGSYEGKTSAEIGNEWNLFRDGGPNGETPAQVAARADQFLAHVKGKILLFSHGHFSRALAARWLKLDVSKGELFFLSVASFSILGHEHKKPVLTLWNSTCHLNS